MGDDGLVDAEGRSGCRRRRRRCSSSVPVTTTRAISTSPSTRTSCTSWRRSGIAASASRHTCFSSSTLDVDRPAGACTTTSACSSSSNASTSPASPGCEPAEHHRRLRVDHAGSLAPAAGVAVVPRCEGDHEPASAEPTSPSRSCILEVCRARRGPQRHARRRRRPTRHRRGPRLPRSPRRTPSSGCPTPPCANRVSGSAPRSCRPTSRGPSSASRSTSRRAACARPDPGSSSRSRSALLAAADELPGRRARRRRRCSASSGSTAAVRAVPGTLALVDALAAHRHRGASIVPVANGAEAALVRRRARARRPLARRAPRLPQGRGDVARLGSAARRRRRRRRRRRARRPRATSAGSRSRGARSRSRPPGGHHLLFVGPPGTGKTMLARRLATDPPAARRTTRRSRSPASTRPPAHATGGRLVTRAAVPRAAPHRVDRRAGRRRQRPARARARSRSRTAACCSSTSSASSRRPRSTRCASRSRSASCASRASPVTLTFPAAFQLVACTNPCPCGLGDRRCRCSDAAARPLPAPALGAVPRPLRPPRARHRARAARRAGRVLGRRRARGSPAALDRQQRAIRRLAVVDERARARGRGGAAPAAARRRATTRGTRWSRRACSPAAARPGSAAWPARSPTSTTRPTSPTPTSRARRCSGATCRERATAARPRRPPLDPVEVAAATLACLPGITPGRACATCSHAARRPGRRAGRGRRGLAAALCAARPRARRDVARAAAQPRVDGDCSRRVHPHVLRATDAPAIPIVDELPAIARGAARRRRRPPTRSTGRGSRSSARAPRRPTGSPTRARSARCSPTRASRS